MTEFGLLVDGAYQLKALASQVASAGPLDGNNDGFAGDDYILSFHRLCGNFEGDRTVAASDFIQFRLAFGGNAFMFEFNNEGAVSAADFIQCRLRFGGSF